MPLYDWQERVAEIALELYQNCETITYDALAEALGEEPKLMERRVGCAYKAMLDEERYEEAGAIAQVFTDSVGGYTYLMRAGMPSDMCEITVKLQNVVNKVCEKTGDKVMSLDTHYSIKNLAIELWDNRTRMTFSELADVLGFDSAWHAGKAVTNAWRFFEKRDDSRACAAISRSFHRNGEC